MKNKIITIILVFFLTLSCSGFSYALANDNDTETNYNYQKDFIISNDTKNTTLGHLDHRSHPSTSLSFSDGPELFSSSKSTILPATYDLRTLGSVTPIKNQAPLSTCWDFASLGSLESCLLPGETWDFSENHVKNILSNLYPEGFDRDYDDGGYMIWVLAYLARWSGPVTESDDPYNPSSGISPEGLTPVKHIQEAVFIPNRESPLDNDQFKQAIMKYGAVCTSMCWNNNYYNPDTYSYYLNKYQSLNHAISLVGWDDNYDKNNFAIPAPGNGAFIVRNSWGSDWGDDGYFYMSYYDILLGNSYNRPYYFGNIAFMNAESPNNYKQIYQYDPLGLVGDISSTSTGCSTAEFMNVFHAKSTNPLTAASFYALAPHTSYQLYTITNSKTTLVAEGVTETAGYKTIKFNQPIPLIAGQEFKIMAKVNTPGYDWPIAIEYADWFSSKATANPGESFIKYEGVWTDLNNTLFSDYPHANVCLKVFTSTAGNLTLQFKTSNLKPVVGKLLKFTINVINTGSDSSLGTQVYYKLPGNLKLTSYQAMGDYNPETGIWNIGDLGVGKLTSLIIYSLVESPGSYINEATISSLNYNYNPINSTRIIINAVDITKPIIINPLINNTKNSTRIMVNTFNVIKNSIIYKYNPYSKNINVLEGTGGFNTPGAVNSFATGTKTNGYPDVFLVLVMVGLIFGVIIIFRKIS